MDWDPDDLPDGFAGESLWSWLVREMRLWRVKRARHSSSLGGSWDGDGEPVDVKAQQQRWYAKLKEDPARVARRNAVRREAYRRRKRR